MQANDVDAFVDQGDGNGSSEQQSIKEKKKKNRVYTGLTNRKINRID